MGWKLAVCWYGRLRYKVRVVGGRSYQESSLYGYNGNMHDWHVYKAEGGGMLYDWGVHLIDQILYMVDGQLSTVYAQLNNVINTKVDDYFRITLYLKSSNLSSFK